MATIPLNGRHWNRQLRPHTHTLLARRCWFRGLRQCEFIRSSPLHRERVVAPLGNTNWHQVLESLRVVITKSLEKSIPQQRSTQIHAHMHTHTHSPTLAHASETATRQAAQGRIRSIPPTRVPRINGHRPEACRNPPLSTDEFRGVTSGDAANEDVQHALPLGACGAASGAVELCCRSLHASRMRGPSSPPVVEAVLAVTSLMSGLSPEAHNASLLGMPASWAMHVRTQARSTNEGLAGPILEIGCTPASRP